LKIAQAVHAMREFTETYPEIDREWFRDSKYVVCLEAEPEELCALIDKARRAGVKACLWIEPDLGNKLTAMALEPCPEARKITSNLGLAR